MVFNPNEEINTYFNFHQRIVILSLLKIIESRKKKTVYVNEVHKKYIEICEEYSIEPFFKSNIIQALKIFEVAGFIKIKDGTITKIDLEPYAIDDWIKAICQDSEFQSFK